MRMPGMILEGTGAAQIINAAGGTFPGMAQQQHAAVAAPRHLGPGSHYPRHLGIGIFIRLMREHGGINDQQGNVVLLNFLDQGFNNRQRRFYLPLLIALYDDELAGFVSVRGIKEQMPADPLVADIVALAARLDLPQGFVEIVFKAVVRDVRRMVIDSQIIAKQAFADREFNRHRQRDGTFAGAPINVTEPRAPNSRCTHCRGVRVAIRRRSSGVNLMFSATAVSSVAGTRSCLPRCRAALSPAGRPAPRPEAIVLLIALSLSGPSWQPGSASRAAALNFSSMR